MVSVAEVVQTWLPANHKSASKGWMAANAVCCHHRGHRADTRQRGNWLIDGQGFVSYICYNCAFRTRYTGESLTDSFRKLLMWMNVPSDVIDSLRMEQLRKSMQGSGDEPQSPLHIPEIFQNQPLPDGSRQLVDLLDEKCDNPDFQDVYAYLQSRGTAVEKNWKYFWAPHGKWNMRRRLIIPFYNQHQQVGYSARYAGTPDKGIPRYVNSALPAEYLFNSSALYKDRRWVIAMEGVMDAISIDGVGILSHVMSTGQIAQLKQSGKEVIVLPDRERKNQDLIDQSLQHGFYVSFPEWEPNRKDAADATKFYGEMYTLRSIISSRTTNELKIGVLRQTMGTA